MQTTKARVRGYGSAEGPRRTRAAGIALLAAATLIAGRAGFAWAAGPPPGRGTEIVRWAADERLWLMLANEASMIALVALIAGLAPLRTSFRTSWAADLLAVGVPLAMAVEVVYGRLVYPVYGLSLTDPASAELVVTVAWGGSHAVWLLRAAAAFLLATGKGRALAVVGGVGAALAAYPWLLPPLAVLVGELAWAAWLVSVGWRLLSPGRLADPGARSL